MDCCQNTEIVSLVSRWTGLAPHVFKYFIDWDGFRKVSVRKNHSTLDKFIFSKRWLNEDIFLHGQ